MENVWHQNAKNVYHARYMIQRHYNGETYHMQLDSHHRFAENWDTTLIKMLHSCDAGEMSVITSYPDMFSMTDPSDGYSEVILDWDPFVAMRYY